MPLKLYNTVRARAKAARARAEALRSVCAPRRHRHRDSGRRGDDHHARIAVGAAADMTAQLGAVPQQNECTCMRAAKQQLELSSSVRWQVHSTPRGPWPRRKLLEGSCDTTRD
jgi:hypothetical protein